MLGEHGQYGHGYLFEENLIVPLVVAYPDRFPPGQRIQHQVRSVDILPTILDLAGLAPVPEIDGQTLTPLVDDHADGQREAWSYSPKSNAGVSVRTPSGLKYVFNNTALTSTATREQVYTSNNTHTGARHTQPTTDLRERTLGRLDKVAGLRVQFRTGPHDSLSGTLLSPLLRSTTVKTEDQTCDCITWEQPGQVSFTVPSATTYSLLIEDVGDEELRITGAAVGTTEHPEPLPFDATFTPNDLDGAKGLSLSQAAWVESTGVSEATTRVRVWSVGARSADPARSGASEQDLLQQLRALGYVR